MNSMQTAIFRESVANALEGFAFTFLDYEDGNFNGLPEDYIYVEMSFIGPAEGSVSLAAPGSFCELLATNALGIDGETAERSVAEDAMMELLNIVCGQITHSIFGDKAVFDLSSPCVRHIDQGKWRELILGNDIVRFWTEGQPLLGRLMIADDGAAG